MKNAIVVFDLVGTLLDLSALDPIFRETFGAARVRREWFTEALKAAFAITSAGDWADFAEIAKASLKVIEERHKNKLSWIGRRRVLAAMKELPPFPDVAGALGELREQGHRLAVLTNSSVKSAKQALDGAGLTKHFEKVLSADAVKRLKPSHEPYLMAAKVLKTRPGRILFTAAHAWDVRGAKRAGCQTCFLSRPEQVLDELAPKPEYVVADLRELAAALR